MAGVPPCMQLTTLRNRLPGATGGEAVACIFPLDYQLLKAIDGTRGPVRLMKALGLEGCAFTPQGCRLVGCLESAPGFSLRGALLSLYA